VSGLVATGKLGSHGTTMCVTINKTVRSWVPWRKGDVIAIRLAGEKLVLERVNLDALAKVKTGEVPTGT